MPLTRREQMLFGAMALLRAGTRPTADLLVEAHKGSKSTALQVLDEFWTTWLPQQLASAAPSEMPPAVDRAVRSVWKMATEHARDLLQAEQADLDAAAERHKANVAAFEAERDARNEELRQALAGADEARAAEAAARKQLASAMEKLADLSSELSRQKDQLQELEVKNRSQAADIAELATLRNALREAERDRDTAQGALTALQDTQKGELGEKLARDAELLKTRDQITQLETRCEDQVQQAARLEQQLQEERSRVINLTASESAARAAADQLQKQVVDLTQQRDRLNIAVQVKRQGRQGPSPKKQPKQKRKTQ